MANVPISNLTTTWNNVSTTFTGVKINVTDTASAAGSLLMDLQVGGVSRFNVGKGGEVSLGGNGSATAPSLARGSSGLYFSGANGLIFFTVTGSYQASVQTGKLSLRQAMELGWESAGAASAVDLSLFRDAADTLAQRRGVNAQTHRIYGTFTDASNYERLSFSYEGVQFVIGAEGAGTGSVRALRLTTTQGIVLDTTNGVAFRTANGGTQWANIDNSGLSIVGRYIQLTEQTAPAAPAANGVRIFAEDDGAGKTRLMARFATGAAVQIAIEP
jgi:hypothetical protein